MNIDISKLVTADIDNIKDIIKSIAESEILAEGTACNDLSSFSDISVTTAIDNGSLVYSIDFEDDRGEDDTYNDILIENIITKAELIIYDEVERILESKSDELIPVIENGIIEALKGGGFH